MTEFVINKIFKKREKKSTDEKWVKEGAVVMQSQSRANSAHALISTNQGQSFFKKWGEKNSEAKFDNYVR